jgi:hypothetical protein
MKAKNELKEKHFREYQQAKEQLARKHEDQYQKDREKVREKYDSRIHKDVQNIKKEHEKELQKDMAQTEAQYAQGFEQDRERLKEHHAKGFAEENAGLKNDNVAVLLEERGYRPIESNLKLNDNEKLKMQNLNLAKKKIKIEENDTLGIQSEDYYTGNEDDRVEVRTKSDVGNVVPNVSESTYKTEGKKEKKIENPNDMNVMSSTNSERMM